MANVLVQDTSLQAIADSIRSKNGLTDTYKPGEMAEAIDDIITLNEGTADATAVAGDILSGKTAYVKGVKVTGNIASKSSSDLTVSGAVVNVPAGHYASAASKAVASGSASTPATTITANPTISVNSSGLIMASVSGSKSVTPSVSAGYVSSGTAGTVSASGSATQQLTTKAATTFNTSTSDQSIAAGTYLTGKQTIKAVTTENIVADNIKSGVTVKVGDTNSAGRIKNVTGTLVAGIPTTLTVNVSTGSAVTATKSGVSVSGTSVNDVCILSLPSAGTWTVTATLSGKTTSESITAEDNYTVTLTYVSRTLADNTPDVIQQVAQEGTGANYWSVGDKTAPIAFNGTVGSLNMTGLSTCAFIIGFNHNSTKEGTGIHFQFGKTTGGVNIAFCDSAYPSSQMSGTWFNMNNDSSNTGGWKNSRMRTVVCPAFKSALPTAWKNVIASCTKYSDNTGGGSNTASYVTSTSDGIFLLAEFEVYGARNSANSAEKNYQAQYAYYANGNSKIKYKHNATSTSCDWWFRSVDATRTNCFCYWSTFNAPSISTATLSYGFAPGFMVG